MSEELVAWMLVVGTGMQVGRWVAGEMRRQNAARDAAGTRVERRRHELAGPPRYDGAAWMLLLVPAVVHLGEVSGWWALG